MNNIHATRIIWQWVYSYKEQTKPHFCEYRRCFIRTHHNPLLHFEDTNREQLFALQCLENYWWLQALTRLRNKSNSLERFTWDLVRWSCSGTQIRDVSIASMKCFISVHVRSQIAQVAYIRINLDMGSANERRRYIVTSSLIGRDHTQNGPCRLHLWNL